MYDISIAGNYRRDVEGGFLIEGVTILAEGIWNGTMYSAMELAKAATKWRDNTVWNRHYEDKSRDESNRIGVLKNQHFSYDRIIADVFLSDGTVEGREMIDLVKTNEIRGISVEHIDICNDSVSTNISFLGAAIVPVPACSICNLSKGENYMDEKELEKLKDTVAELAKSIETGDTKELKTTVADLATAVKELKSVDIAPIAEQAKKDAQTISELKTTVCELSETVKKQDDIVTRLKDEPVTNLGQIEPIEDTYAEITISKDGITRRM